MAFDQPTRNRLARFVAEARALLSQEFTRQLQHEYGMDPNSGDVTGLERLTALDDARRETARILRETLDYYLAGMETSKKNRQETLDRIVREQAFTVLNRLCALRMAEGRGLLIESIGQGYQSKGFQLYLRLAGAALGETGEVYKSYLFGIFDELAVDLPALFDHFSPEGRLFPREAALLKVLELINDPEIDPLWVEDETIGWIYQYFNSQEERKQMRAESSAPRNSRELAVRNQFFTPRYVVEFLTDNTLGRIWYEMTKGDTRLTESCRYLVRRPNEIFMKEGECAPEQEQTNEDLSQEELLKQPVYIAHRPLKDPREIKMLDPACGSMHFGLYAFDLYKQIYEEAWELEERLVADGLWRLADLDSLHETYPDKVAFLRDVPRLIIERNIHGIDIDPRSVQIAGLSLWLRAQKSWHALGFKQHERPTIRKSNIVCAEPMPGDREMLEEFLATLNEDRLEGLVRKVLNIPDGQRVRITRAMVDALADLVRKVWQEMELAGEAGSLLKIEETLRYAIAQARIASKEKAPLFRVLEYGMEHQVGEQNKPSIAVEGNDFWGCADNIALRALHEYAIQAENGGVYRRRLFAGDAVQGFAFISVLREKYDVVSMNPPFGETSKKIKDYIRDGFPNSSTNLYEVFQTRGNQLLNREGLLGIISSRTFITYRDFEQYRQNLLDVSPIICLADLGWEILDGAQVETAAYITINATQKSDWFGPIFRITDIPLFQKAEILSNVTEGYNKEYTFYFNRKIINLLPGSPLCYWTSAKFIKEITRSNALYPEFAYVGLGASPHSFFFRAWWEVEIKQLTLRWKRICRGGDYSPFYRPNNLVIDWYQNGNTVKEYILKKYPYLNGNFGWKIQDEDKYYLPGLTWGKRNERFNVQAMPSDHIFTDEGQGIVPLDHSKSLFLLGYLNSALVAYFLSLTSGLQKHYVYIRPIPVIDLTSKAIDTISSAASKIAIIKQKWDSTSEISPIFLSPLVINLDSQSSISKINKKCIELWNSDTVSIRKLRKRINDMIIAETSLSESDIHEIQGLLAYYPKDYPSTDCFIVQKNQEREITVFLISHFFGCVLGRWDIRHVISENNATNLSDPFSNLPACPSGMLQNCKGLPAFQKDVQVNYPLRISWSGILVDGEGEFEDVEKRMREVLQVIWKDRAEVIEHEACQFLGVSSLIDYFRKPTGFFADHLKRYSKSRRFAPIYWPLSTPSNSYTLWLYYHRINDQILYTCINDFVDPKFKNVSDEASSLRKKQDRSPAEEKELEQLVDFERELKDFRAELLRVAAFWKPNLNDGVQITAAPLWKLFQHKPWQKKLKGTWEKLEAGEYDWAHLAYSIWPERVREKCKTDKSLAIAHDLEHMYEEPEKPKKKKAKIQKRFEDDAEDFFDEG